MKSFILFLICTFCLLAAVVVIAGTAAQKPPQRAIAQPARCQ
jgi:hypothetical protein